VSSGDGEKRTSACLNIAQDIAPSIAQAVSIGVNKGVDSDTNDSKQAQTQQLTARGLIKSVSTRAINIYSSIYGEVRVEPHTISKIYHWDGHIHAYIPVVVEIFI
jgi:hypothetical protein